MTDDRWRKVSEEMPPEYEDVLVIDLNRHRAIAWRAAYGKGPSEWRSFDNEFLVEHVTHWRPLPAPPEED